MVHSQRDKSPPFLKEKKKGIQRISNNSLTLDDQHVKYLVVVMFGGWSLCVRGGWILFHFVLIFVFKVCLFFWINTLFPGLFFHSQSRFTEIFFIRMSRVFLFIFSFRPRLKLDCRSKTMAKNSWHWKLSSQASMCLIPFYTFHIKRLFHFPPGNA